MSALPDPPTHLPIPAGAATPSPATIHPADLLPPEGDARDRLTPAYLAWEARLAEDVRKRGVLSPIHVVRRGDGRLAVLTGETRRRAALHAGLRAVPVIVRAAPLTEAEAAMERLLENEMRSDFTDAERAEAYLQLLEQNSWSQDELAQRVGRSPSVVSKVLAPYRRLPEDLRGRVGKGEGKVPVTAACAIARLPSEEAVRELFGLALSRGMKRDAVLALVAQRLGKKTGSTKPVRLRLGAVEMTLKGATLEAVQASLDAVSAALKRLGKDRLPLSVLPSLLAER